MLMPNCPVAVVNKSPSLPEWQASRLSAVVPMATFGCYRPQAKCHSAGARFLASARLAFDELATFAPQRRDSTPRDRWSISALRRSPAKSPRGRAIWFFRAENPGSTPAIAGAAALICTR